MRHLQHVLACWGPGEGQKVFAILFQNVVRRDKIIEMRSHAFGLTQSPFVVINVVKTHASEEASELPLAAKAVLEDSIVDDILTGCKTFRRLNKLKKEIEKLYEKINMHAHKWATNSPRLRDAIDSEDSAAAVCLGKDSEALFCAEGEDVPSIKCLGILWHPETDKLQFFSSSDFDEVKWTMRKISSRTSRLFDPLGLICPLMLEGKLLLQSLWKLKLGWDEPVPVEVAAKYNRWLKRISHSHLSHINRRVKAPFKSQFDQLLIFHGR